MVSLLSLCMRVYVCMCVTAGESGSADTVRDPRGFAVKFYTDEGNWDLTGNNTPIFFIRDALLVSEPHDSPFNRQVRHPLPGTLYDVCPLPCLSVRSSPPSSTRRSATPRRT